MAGEADDVFVLKWNDYNSVMTSSFAWLRKTEQVTHYGPELYVEKLHLSFVNAGINYLFINIIR